MCQHGDSIFTKPTVAPAKAVKGAPCAPEQADQILAWCSNSLFPKHAEKEGELPFEQGSLEEATASWGFDQRILQGFCQSLLHSQVCSVTCTFPP